MSNEKTHNREKLEHIQAYAMQQLTLGALHCKIPPDDMVEIMALALSAPAPAPAPAPAAQAEQRNSQVFEKIQALAVECHQLACATDIGQERTELFSVYHVLHNLTRRGYAEQVGIAMNPLLNGSVDDEDDQGDDE